MLLVPLIARPDSAAGVTLTVNSTADGVDASPGNGVAHGRRTVHAAGCDPGGEQPRRERHDRLRHRRRRCHHRTDDRSAPDHRSGHDRRNHATGLDARCDLSGRDGHPCVELSGTSLTTTPQQALLLSGGNSVVRGLVINGFTAGTTGGHGIRIDTAGGNTVDDNYIGTNVTETSSVANDANGVFVFGTADNVITNNLLSGNGTNGVAITNGGRCATRYRNRIGTNAAGTAAVPNGVTGVMITGPDNIVGGTAASNRNVISGSTSDGVRIGNNVGRGTRSRATTSGRA